MPVGRADTDARYEDALSVRYAVFVDEQGVPEDLEVDEHEDDATHFVAYDDGEPVGAARLREYDDGVGKVERVAVRESCRGEGWGAALMDELEATASERYDELYLHAQLPAAGFYDDRGYVREGEQFEEAGIPHVAMRKRLS
ncbi:GNAT family acetyltransferase [Halobacterium hubeiense]|uniref:GNAT family acetyltransferase n=1 Tax=Halobacterium hubeiense TaxID=1407499 RepID=A0A0U5H2G3_9EURY|nr:GNAT family N-acetyltransferase [Halobacterium hubeiense]CQH58325.1 GNAT family acetyltransferase [Halobacterium hubeiense]